MDPLVAPKPLATTLTTPARPPTIRWIGGVLRPYRCKHRGKPMRVAAWITRSGSLLSAAIVEGHGPTVLRELLTELLASTSEAARPSELVVWPNVRAAFADLEYPPVVVEHDIFLTVVIEDHHDAGHIPWQLQVRRA